MNHCQPITDNSPLSLVNIDKTLCIADNKINNPTTKEENAVEKQGGDGDSVLAKSRKEFLALRKRLRQKEKSGIAEKIDADLKRKTRMTPERMERRITI